MTKQPDRQDEEASNKSSSISANIEEYRKIKATNLKLSGQQIIELPESIGQLTQLKILELDRNQLTDLPESIGQLTELGTLKLTDNRLTKLPESIGQLTELLVLTLSGNQLTQLPESIGQLTKLETLELADNRLTKLPESIGQLTNLRTLHIANNQLTELPESLLQLKSLNALYLHGNDALGLPEELFRPAPQDTRNKSLRPIEPIDILGFYFKAQVAQRPLNEAKLILVGRGGVGKTSIVNRLVYNIGPQQLSKVTKITEWNLTLNTNENVRLNIWDFGGQEIAHRTHQFFLTQHSLYLLVLDGREYQGDADAEYWLKLIEIFGGDSPVIIVLNKIEERPFDVSRRALRQKHTMICDFIQTDCESGNGLEQLRDAIKLETDRLEHLRDAFPPAWFVIKYSLAGMRENYLSSDKYQELCAKLGENDSEAQSSLAFYLHSLGIALNYKDHPRLKDTHVLNPHWVTNGVYKILNSDKLEEQKGEFRLNDLSAILDREEYPEKMHSFLFDLMKKFEFCFTFPDDDTHCLIPDLLDKQEPAEAADFNPQECLNFQYHYTVLPEGLLPRFIVHTYAMSEGPRYKRWRTGVILEFDGCQALVKADTQDKKVFISVSGPALSPRRLLTAIRSHFERIHRDIRSNPQEMVPLPKYPDEMISYRELLVIEQMGMKEFPKVIDKNIIEIDVGELLNGVDPGNTRRITEPIDEPRRPVRLFYSYSHKDESFREELEAHLNYLKRNGFLEPWHDRKVGASDDWKKSIDDNLKGADIILLLVSADFIASDYCYEEEMKAALERNNNGEARVVPIIVRDVNWKNTPFARLQALPKDAMPVSLWSNRDSAWKNVAEEIEKLVEEIQKKSRLLH